MNILTTNGFVGRYVTDWAGPDAILTIGEDPPRRAQLPRRHDDDHRHGHREGRRRTVVDGRGRGANRSATT